MTKAPVLTGAFAFSGEAILNFPPFLESQRTTRRRQTKNMNAENHTTGVSGQKLKAEMLKTETPVPTAEPFIDKREVARRMGRTVRAVDKMMRRGILPYYKFDWQVAFRWSEVEAQLARTCRVAGKDEG
jgi:hypothetical protein